MNEVARREVVTRVRSTAFRVTTVVLVLVSVAAVVGAALFGDGDDDETRTYEVAAGAELGPALRAGTPDGIEVDVVELGEAAAREAVSNGEVDLAVLAGGTLVWEREADPELGSIVVGALTRAELDARAVDLGISPDDAAELVAPVRTTEEIVDPASDSAPARTAVALIAMLVMFFAIQAYGSQVAMVVVEEKSNRIVEILLSLVSPRSLLVGKIAGIGVLALCHVVIIVLGLLGALAVSDFADVPVSAYTSLPLVVVVFVLGFTLYGTMFALVGSLISRQEDGQQAMLPVFLPIFIGYVLAFQAVGSPDSTLATVVSIVPLTSPFALPITVAQGTASLGVVIVALALLVASAVAVLALAARVYEFTLLRTGSRIPLGEALRLARGDRSSSRR
ncbi:ABC transporter permease [Ilumatobacter sp.]|uniref:ABC transporter permease n=1 Tax=Ilumatobacter sp. TaxID=1967498 RepID=UPI003B51DB23